MSPLGACSSRVSGSVGVGRAGKSQTSDVKVEVTPVVTRGGAACDVFSSQDQLFLVAHHKNQHSGGKVKVASNPPQYVALIGVLLRTTAWSKDSYGCHGCSSNIHRGNKLVYRGWRFTHLDHTCCNTMARQQQTKFMNTAVSCTGICCHKSQIQGITVNHVVVGLASATLVMDSATLLRSM